ncbi:MAG: hypothetical protein JO008_05405, partial [Alphaproteobacteria bacterium]|nr:hypothetical protein [Alphaproteobacteria bacterium]
MSPAEPLPAASQSNPFDAFLRPESMVTPGALGALTMLITNALANNFGVLTPGLIALIVSFILGVTALVKASSILQKIVYYVINSRIIFSVATGSNTLGRTAAAGGSPPRTAGIVLFPAAYAWPLEARLPHTPQAVHAVQFFKPWFQGSAAQESA